MKKFRHLNIIKKYSQNYTISRKVTGSIVGGRPSITLETFDCDLAIMELKETELQSFSNFKRGDIKIYFLKNQSKLPTDGDFFIVNGFKYTFKDPKMNFLYPDYAFFVGVLEVTHVS